MSKSKGRRLAEWLRNLDSNSKASSSTLADDSITAAKLQTDAVTNPKIADGAIHTANLADANVTFAKLHTDVTITSSTGISGSNDNDTTVPTTAALIDYVGAQIQTKDNSDEITEGTTNLYFTNERVDDRVNSLLTAGTGITLTYDDTANTLTVAGAAQYGDSDVASYLSTNGYGTSSSIIASITDSAPTTLDTLNELAAALGDDANFSTTVTNSIGTKWTQDNTKISNWDTAYGWGNHASAGYITSFDITTQTDSKYLRSDVNDQMLAQLYGGFGAVSTGGTTDWNHSTNARSGGGYTLLTGSASNGPGGSTYYHPFSFEYNSKNGTGNMTQLAIPYNGSSIWHRYIFSSSWSGWVQEWNSGNDGSGSGLDADTLDGQQGSYYTSLANATGQFTMISATNASSRDKIRVYPSSNYAIGMQDNITYGHLNDWAMTFQMNDDAQSDRGFWWGDTGHGLGNGAMSLTTNGRATIANSLSIGQGESITGPNSTTLYVGGNAYINAATYGGLSIGETPTNYEGWDTQLNVNGSGHSRINVKTANVRMGIYAHDNWQGGTMGHVGTYTNHQLSFICNATQRALLTTAGSLSTTSQGTLWGASNDGSGSGLDADTLDGIQASGFMRLGASSTSTVTQIFSAASGQPMLWRDTNATNGTNCNIYSYWYAQSTTLGYIGYGSGGDSNLYLSNASVGSIYLAATSANGFLANGSVMWHAGNDGSGSGLDADLLDGYDLAQSGANKVLRTQQNGYLLLDNWVRIGNGTGLYCASNGAYLYNDTTYGWFARSSSNSSASVRLQTSNGTNRGWFYADSSYIQGFLTSAGGWGLKMDNSGNVTATGNVTAYSDIRLKKDIKPLEGALAKVLQLRGVQYTRKDTKQKEIGVIAQEVENILPEVVHISDATAQEKDKEEYTDIRSVDYGRMVSVLIEAIKEQQAQIEELKEKLK